MYQSITYPSADKQTVIHAYIWRPHGQIRGVLQIIHGMAEHALRYAPLADYLTERGFLVCAEDHLGHGKSVLSPNEMGYFGRGDGTDRVLADIRRLALTVREETGGLPYFVLGHSMGSFFCRNYIAQYGDELAGAMIMGTGTQPAALTAFGKFAARTVALFCGWEHRSRLINALAFGAYGKHFEGRTSYDWLSRNRDNVDRYIADDLCGITFTCSGFYTLFSVINRACRTSQYKAVPSSLPIFILSGSDDPVGNYSKGVIKVYDKYMALGKSAEMMIYKDARHEILNDFCALQVMEDISSFMCSHI